MDNAQLNKQLKLLTKRCSDVEHEKKLLANDYEGLKRFVIRTGIISLVCLILRITVLQIFLNSKDVSVKALGRFLSPFDYAVFLVTLILFLIRGFDLFINADTKYSKLAAKKLDKPTVSEKMDELNSEIMRLQFEIDKAETTLYEQGGKPDYKEELKEEQQENPGFETLVQFEEEHPAVERQTQDSSTGAASEEKPEVLVRRAVFEEHVEVKKMTVKEHRDEEKNVFAANNGKNSIDDILNGLDDFSLDEEEFENSSELWEQDTMKHYK